MKLYYADTLMPRKACAVARHAGAAVEFVRIDLAKAEQRSPRFLAINPNGKVPALTDGALRLWESNAIMAYLADKAGSDLWPRDSRQFEVVRWLSWDAEHFTRNAGALYFERIVKARFGIGAPDAAVVDEALGEVRRHAAVLEGHLRGRRWLVGDGPTVADFAVAITFPYADAAGIPLDEFPEVRRWHDRLCAFEAWLEPFPAEATAWPDDRAAA
jgi:glutathione S-transferase